MSKKPRYPKHAPTPEALELINREIERRYQNGEKAGDIARDLKISSAAFTRWHGVAILDRFSYEDRTKIERMAETGMTDEAIAIVMGTSESTLKRHCADELKRGRVICSSKVLSTLYDLAVSGDHPNVTMFWAKAREGWRDTDAPKTAVQVNNAINATPIVTIGGRKLIVDDEGVSRLGKTDEN